MGRRGKAAKPELWTRVPWTAGKSSHVPEARADRSVDGAWCAVGTMAPAQRAAFSENAWFSQAAPQWLSYICDPDTSFLDWIPRELVFCCDYLSLLILTLLWGRVLLHLWAQNMDVCSKSQVDSHVQWWWLVFATCLMKWCAPAVGVLVVSCWGSPVSCLYE